VRAFFDTNILIYAQGDDAKGRRAREILAQGGFTSVQVFNEFAAVQRRKFGRSWDDIAAALADIAEVLGPPVTMDHRLHQAVLALAAAHGFSFYDALVLAAALEARCDVFFSEDMQNGRKLESKGREVEGLGRKGLELRDLQIVNPFT
jgi:predicted nucleic acid-binding protein